MYFEQTSKMFYRSLLLFAAGLMATFGSDTVHLPGAGPLGCLTLAFVAAFNGNLHDEPTKKKKKKTRRLNEPRAEFVFLRVPFFHCHGRKTKENEND